MSELQNPLENDLGAGLSREQIEEAVRLSGYPLQTEVAKTLRDMKFRVFPEWSYIDKDTGAHRSVDMRATISYDEPGDRTRPHLDLIIECKQSQLPYIFFTGESTAWGAELPFFAGLKNEIITIKTDDDRSTWSYRIGHTLGINEHKYYRDDPPVAFTLSKCERKGKGLILSGDEPYNSLIRPLVKGMGFLGECEAPPKTAVYFDAHMAVALAVLDSPMVIAEGSQIRMGPWVRVLRHENSGGGKTNRGRMWVIEVIHKAFLQAYLADHLLPFAQDCADAVRRHGIELAECEGFVKEMGRNWYTNVEPHLRPMSEYPVGGIPIVRVPRRKRRPDSGGSESKEAQ